MQEVKILTGVMDTESSIETIGLTDYLDALNITNVLQGDSKTNYSTSVDGNLKITTYTPLGQNRVIGSTYIREAGKVYFVRYNSNQYHQIVEFDYNKREERIIFENMTDSNGDILNINSNTYFRDINLLGDNLLILNSGENEIYQIDINRDRTVILQEEDLTLIRKPIPTPPKTKYIDNNSMTINNLRGKLFQFKSQVGYANNLDSVWSHTSDRIVPINEPADGQGQSTLLSNSIEITIKVDEVSKLDVIRVAMRPNMDTWVLIREIKYKDLIELPSTINVLTGNNESYNSTTKEYKLIFSNDGAYPLLDQVEVNNFYDAIPNKSSALEVVNGNIIALGGTTEGYDNNGVKMSADVSYYDPNITNVVVDPDVPTFRYIDKRTYFQPTYFRYTHMYSGIPKQGDKIIVNYVQTGTPQTILEIVYDVTLSDENEGLKITLQRAVTQFTSYNLQAITFQQQTVDGIESIVVTNFVTSPWHIFGIIVRNGSLGSVSTQSINCLKNNSSYQISLNMYDNYMRPFKIITGDSLRVNTNSIALTKGLLPQISFYIEGQAQIGRAHV